MRSRVLLLALLLAAACAADAQQKHRRRHRRLRTTTSTTEAPAEGAAEGGAEAAGAALVRDEEADQLARAALEREDERRYQAAERARLGEAEGEGREGEEGFMDDPCLKVHCSAGRVCELDAAGEARCNCIRDCPYETDHRRKVCTSHNETWASDCEVYRQRCLCLDGSELCRGAQYHHVQVEYYGACREMPACSPDEMADFPRRMRDWLFNIMRDLAARRELPARYTRLQREAETDLAKRWANAAVWKWCDLDAHDNDRFVSRHELFPIRAPLMALEHCIAPFLDGCDADDDHRVTLAEWGRCLQLPPDELQDRCDEFADDEAPADDDDAAADDDGDAAPAPAPSATPDAAVD